MYSVTAVLSPQPDTHCSQGNIRLCLVEAHSNPRSELLFFSTLLNKLSILCHSEGLFQIFFPSQPLKLLIRSPSLTRSLVHQCCILTLVHEESQLGLLAVWARCLLALLSKVPADFKDIFPQSVNVKCNSAFYCGFH